VPRSFTDLAGLNVSAEDFLTAVLDTAAQPIWVVDPRDLIRFANHAALAALGYDNADELLGCHSHETIHHRRPDGTAYPVEECPMLLPRVTGERVASDLDWFFRRDGSMFPVSYVSVPLEMPEGRGAVVAFTKIEDRLRAEQLLRERDEVLATQQASLRRIATLVGGGAASAEVFAAIAREAARILRMTMVQIWRYEPDGTATVLGAWSERPHPFQAGTNWPLDDPTIAALLQQPKAGSPVRIDDVAEIAGTIGGAARAIGIRSAAGAPIVVDGELWGMMGAGSADREPMPDRVEDRLAEFTELVATAISNTASREQLARLADEQAALRRVATLVAAGVPPPKVFAAVARELGLLVGGDATHIGRYEVDGTATLIASWSRTGDHVPIGTVAPIDGENVCSLVLRTGAAARMNSYDDASGPIAAMLRELGIRSSVGAPIVVDGRRWGVTIVSSTDDRPLAADTESRIAAFTELVATAISTAQARADVGRLAEEQAALRRVATLVAQAVPPGELFEAVTDEVGTLLGADLAGMIRYEADDTMTVVAAEGGHAVVGSRWSLQGDGLAPRISRTGRPARVDDWRDISGPIAEWIREELGLRSSVGCPILVEGRLWGALMVHSKQRQPLPRDTESRLRNFTELLATAISNAHGRAEGGRLADEQAALRRVATLVARDVSPNHLFGAVVEEVGRLLDADLAGMIRYLTDDTITAVATWAAEGEHPPVPGAWPLEGDRLATTISRTGRPTREDDWGEVAGPIAAFVREELGIRSSVGSPIIVEGRVWGGLFVHSTTGQPLPGATESRLGNFTELVATAMSNAQARADLRRLAEEQAALRRVATLVAREPSPDEVFAAVAEEVGRLLHVEDTRMVRYEADGTATVVASWGQLATALPVGTRVTLDGESAGALVRRTGRPARIDDFTNATGAFAASLRQLGVRSAVGAPILVDGRLWGAMSTASLQPDPIPPDTEARMGQFTELVATAISNIEARSDLAASRARMVAAADEERRRLVRDLHDGAQQRLVHTVITLKLARRALEQDASDAPELVTEAIDQAEQATSELRELSHGILPQILMHGGLRAGVEALASRTPVPVDIDVSVGRLPATIEATAYFVVAEALTNVAKHARARSAAVSARIEHNTLRVDVRDNGVGGARPGGSGLVGLGDRLAALDGRLEVASPADGGTLVAADIPLRD
jgi:PAS domain S-box-containing protein